MIEMVMDRGVGRGDFLQSLYIPEPSHRSLSSSEGMVRVLGSVVEPATADLASLSTDLFHSAIHLDPAFLKMRIEVGLIAGKFVTLKTIVHAF